MKNIEKALGKVDTNFFLVTLLWILVSLAVAYLTIAYLAGLESRFVVRSQLGPSISPGSFPGAGLHVGHTIHAPIEGLLPPTGIEPTPFRNSASEVTGLQVHATTLSDTITTKQNT